MIPNEPEYPGFNTKKARERGKSWKRSQEVRTFLWLVQSHWIHQQ